MPRIYSFKFPVTSLSATKEEIILDPSNTFTSEFLGPLLIYFEEDEISNRKGSNFSESLVYFVFCLITSKNALNLYYLHYC